MVVVSPSLLLSDEMRVEGEGKVGRVPKTGWSDDDNMMGMMVRELHGYMRPVAGTGTG